MPVLNSQPNGEPTPTPVPIVNPRIDSVIGQWRIDAKLGNGTSAYVYAATSTKDGRRAALKILRAAHVDDATRRRFAREGYVANAVGHPGVVQIFDQGVTADGALFIVMELLDGESLEALRQRHGGALRIDRAVDIGCELLDVVAAAHTRNIVHRDIKPANVFLTADGTLKVLDFGLANISDSDRPSSITRSGVVIGTPAFMPPEQARGRRSEVDARSDVWAIGATLFTLITGRAVHVAASTSGQMLAALTKPAPPLASVAPQVSPELARVVDRALAFERKDRWEDADTMGRALRAARSSGLESSTPVFANGEGVTPVAVADGSAPTGLPSLPSLADECDDAEAQTRVAGYAALALLTSPEAHRDVVVKEQPPAPEPHSLAPAQCTVPPATFEPAPAGRAPRAASAFWINAFAGACAALVAGGITLGVLASVERTRARTHATASAPPMTAMEAPPVVLDPLPEPPLTATIVVEPLAVAEPAVAAPEPSPSPPPAPIAVAPKKPPTPAPTLAATATPTATPTAVAAAPAPQNDDVAPSTPSQDAPSEPTE